MVLAIPLMTLLSHLTALASAEQIKAPELSVHPSGNCGPGFLRKARGMRFNAYKPRLSFRDVAVKLSPERAVVPGCVNLTISGIRVLRPVRRLTAEIEMRIGGSPDPSNRKLSRCGRRSASCGCGERNSCLFCDFCKNLRKRGSVVSLRSRSFGGPSSPARSFPGQRHGSKRRSLVGALGEGQPPAEGCDCEGETTPGVYDIHTEFCTPPREELEAELEESGVGSSGGETLSMFTTIYLYDDFALDLDLDLYRNTGLRQYFQISRNAKTIGCFFLGTDVHIPQLDRAGPPQPLFPNAPSQGGHFGKWPEEQ